nr:hypothetical protein [Micromonospora sp. DSM 115978]
MRVRMKGQISGSRNGVPWPPKGGVIDLPDDEAAQLCDAGMATPVTGDEVETATAPTGDVETRETSGLTTKTGPAKRSTRS